MHLPSPPPPRQEVLGIDLGNTIIKYRQLLPHAFDVIARLNRERFGTHIHIVSRVDETQELRARAWIIASALHRQTGIPEHHVHFCRERREKGPIALRIGATHFIDDRPEVLSHMPHVPFRILFDPVEEDVATYASEMTGIPRPKTWKEVETLLLPP